jgi:hypothetical protein
MLASVVRRPPSVVRRPPSVVRRPTSAISRAPSAVLGDHRWSKNSCMHVLDTRAAKSMHVLRESSTSCALDFNLISRYLDAW